MVIEGNLQPPLISAETCEKLKCFSMTAVCAIDEKITKNAVTKESILREYADIFDGLGKLPGEHYIVIDDHVRPV